MPSHDTAGRVTSRKVLGGAVALALSLALTLVGGVGVSAAAPPAPAVAPTFALPEAGDLLTAFDRNDYNEQDGAPAQVASPDDPGRQSVQFSLDAGAQRSELKPRIADQHEGDVQYYSYNVRLAPDFPVDVNTWQLILQWHQYGDSGSPPVALEVRENRLMLASEGTDRQDLGPVAGGDRLDLTLRIAFSRDADRGTVDVWRGADHVLRGYKPPSGTLIDDGNYAKFGLYRDTAIDAPARLWVDDFRAGSTLASVRSPVATAGATPVENDGPVSPTPASSSSSEVVIWIAGALLVLVAVLAVVRMRRRVPH